MRIWFHASGVALLLVRGVRGAAPRGHAPNTVFEAVELSSEGVAHRVTEPTPKSMMRSAEVSKGRLANVLVRSDGSTDSSSHINIADGSIRTALPAEAADEPLRTGARGGDGTVHGGKGNQAAAAYPGPPGHTTVGSRRGNEILVVGPRNKSDPDEVWAAAGDLPKIAVASGDATAGAASGTAAGQQDSSAYDGPPHPGPPGHPGHPGHPGPPGMLVLDPSKIMDPKELMELGGGLHVDSSGRVVDAEGKFLPGLNINAADLAYRAIDMLSGTCGVIEEDYPYACVCNELGICDGDLSGAKCTMRIGEGDDAIRRGGGLHGPTLFWATLLSVFVVVSS